MKWACLHFSCIFEPDCLGLHVACMHKESPLKVQLCTFSMATSTFTSYLLLVVTLKPSHRCSSPSSTTINSQLFGISSCAPNSEPAHCAQPALHMHIMLSCISHPSTVSQTSSFSFGKMSCCSTGLIQAFGEKTSVPELSVTKFKFKIESGQQLFIVTDTTHSFNSWVGTPFNKVTRSHSKQKAYKWTDQLKENGGLP